MGSRAPKGSSRSSRRGWEASARASATRCRCPPDSCAGRRGPTSGSSISSSSSLTLCTQNSYQQVLDSNLCCCERNCSQHLLCHCMHDNASVIKSCLRPHLCGTELRE